MEGLALLHDTGSPNDAHVKCYRLAKLPNYRFVCGRDWHGPESYQFGVYWGKRLDAQQGELVYRKYFILRWTFYFRMWIER